MDKPTNGPKIDYQLVYHLRDYKTSSLSNLEVSYCNEAKEKARKEHNDYLEAICRHTGHEKKDLEVTNIMCMAKGILSHVYAPGGPKGVGKRKCIFCGSDDFDD